MSALASDDPVVREIPVFLSTELSEVLYLIQHPLFSTARGEPPVPSTARLRPLHGKLETSTVIPLNEHFDQQARFLRVAFESGRWVAPRSAAWVLVRRAIEGNRERAGAGAG